MAEKAQKPPSSIPIVGNIHFWVLDEEVCKMSKISKKNYESSGHSMDTITLKSSMPNIISNRPFYSDHSTYLWAL